MDSNTKKILIVLLILIAVFVAVFILGKQLGKKGNADLKDAVEDIPGSKHLTEKEKEQIQNLVEDLHEDINEKIGFRNIEPYQKLNSLSDTLFVAVHNTWELTYQDDDSLRENIENEFGSWSWSSGVADQRFSTLKETLKKRFERLKIK